MSSLDHVTENGSESFAVTATAIHPEVPTTYIPPPPPPPPPPPRPPLLSTNTTSATIAVIATVSQQPLPVPVQQTAPLVVTTAPYHVGYAQIPFIPPSTYPAITPQVGAVPVVSSIYPVAPLPVQYYQALPPPHMPFQPMPTQPQPPYQHQQQQYVGGKGADNDDDDSGVLEVHGNATTFNLNPLLHQNILEADYFRALYQLSTYAEVVDEVHVSVTHAEPYMAGTQRHPSTAFCLLLKFLLMRLTRRQIHGLIETNDGPLVRAIGFLYLRYAAPPADLWKWFEPHIESEEPLSASADPSKATTVGQFLVRLLTEMQYFGTTLPRIPVPIERKTKVLLLLLDEKRRRRRANKEFLELGFFGKGSRVRAIFADEENEPAWYDAVVDSRERDTPGGTFFWVTFPEYGNTSCVDLGDMELSEQDKKRAISSNRRSRSAGRGSRSRSPVRGSSRRERSRSRSRSRGRDRDRDRDRDRGDRRRRSASRSRSHSRGRDRGPPSAAATVDLMQKVLESSRNASLAVGRNYGNRPASYKGSLSLKLDRHTVRDRSRSRSRGGHGRSTEVVAGGGRRSRSRSKERQSQMTAGGGGGGGQQRHQQKELEQRLKKLKERYGDASVSGSGSGSGTGHGG